MPIIVREYDASYLSEAMQIWNEVVEEGVAFPQTECLGEAEADAFFRAQTYTGIAVDTETDAVLGMYILHPNNVGRCGHRLCRLIGGHGDCPHADFLSGVSLV
ncbi:MAG: hypothetical protein LUC87_09055 [Clostridiales bacterium]|nr:hypothetical protein [Clostridiales bacterium]